jgi:hypothetical protein
MEMEKEIKRLVEKRKEIAKKSLLDCRWHVEQLKRDLKHVREFFVEQTKSCDYEDIVKWLEGETKFSELMQEINLIYTLHEFEKNKEQENFYQEQIDKELFKLLNI